MATPSVAAGVYGSQANDDSFIIPKPSGLAAGDMLLFLVPNEDNTNTPGWECLSSTGWQIVSGMPTHDTTGAHMWCTVLWKIATSGDAAATDFTFQPDYFTYSYPYLMRVVDHDGTAPILLASHEAADGLPLVLPAGTTPEDNMLIVGFGATWTDGPMGGSSGGGWTVFPGTPQTQPVGFYQEMDAAGSWSSKQFGQGFNTNNSGGSAIIGIQGTKPPVTQIGTPTVAGSFDNAVSKPTGAQAGDHYVIFVNMQDEDSTPPTITSTGFTNHGGVQGTSSPGNYWSMQVLTKPFDGSEGSSFTLAGQTTWRYFVCTIIRDWDGTAPILGAISSAVSEDPTIPGVTVLAEDSYAFIHVCGYDPLVGTTATEWATLTAGHLNASPLLGRAFDAGGTGNVVVSTPADTRVQGWMVVFGQESEAGTAYAVTASGSGTSGGSVAMSLQSGPASHSITASGTGQSAGSVALNLVNQFPTVATTNGEIGTSLGSNNPSPMPTGIVAGDLLIAVVSNDNPSTTNITGSTGWTQISSAVQGTNVIKQAVFARIADLSANDTFSASGAAQDYTTDVLRINSHGVTNVATDIKVGVAATAATGNADPPALAPGFTRNWLWLAIATVDATTGNTISADPTNYTNVANRTSASSTSSVLNRIARRALAGTTENPGTFTNTSRPWIAQTIAIPSYVPPLQIVATGEGQSDGSAAIEILPGGTAHPITASGTGTSTGSAAIGIVSNHPITASGTGTSTGSADIRNRVAMSASGTGVSTGSAALRATLVMSASGTGVSGGAVALGMVFPTTASGTGQSAGSATLGNRIPISASGSGQSGGSATFGPITMSASGTGQSAGSAIIGIGQPMSASGTGQSAGSADVTIFNGPIQHQITGTGSGTSTGSAALKWALAVSASGTGISAGTATLGRTMPVAAGGSGQSGGSAAIAATMPLAAQGEGVSGGAAALRLRQSVSAAGTGQSGGHADIRFDGEELPMSASGTGTSSGSAAIAVLHVPVDIAVEIGPMRAESWISIGAIRAVPPVEVQGFATTIEVSDYDAVVEVGELAATPPVIVSDMSEAVSASDLIATERFLVGGFEVSALVGATREDR